jgi:hypothetical protein
VSTTTGSKMGEQGVHTSYILRRLAPKRVELLVVGADGLDMLRVDFGGSHDAQNEEGRQGTGSLVRSWVCERRTFYPHRRDRTVGRGPTGADNLAGGGREARSQREAIAESAINCFAPQMKSLTPRRPPRGPVRRSAPVRRRLTAAKTAGCKPDVDRTRAGTRFG